MNDRHDPDVVIVGAGPVGLSFAASLKDANLRVLILERLPEAALSDPAYDGREIALTWRSIRIMRDLGTWQRLPIQECFAIRGARVLDGERTDGIDIRPPRQGPSPSPMPLGSGVELGYIVSNHLLRRAAYEAVRATSCAELRAGCQVVAVSTGEHGAEVSLADGTKLRTRLLVAADSRFSETRRGVGIPARHTDFGKTMLVCRMRHAMSHDHIACEWFGYRQTLATLPLGERQSSVVLTLPHMQIEALKALPPADFAKDIGRRLQGRLGAMSLEGERFAYPLVAVYPERFIAPRFATLGDAAVGMHPVTAHGFNFGLLGQQTLARLILEGARGAAGLDPGADSLLRSFDRAHRRATRPLFLATNAIVRLYTDDSPPAHLVRGVLMGVARRAPFLVSQISRVLMQAN